MKPLIPARESRAARRAALAASAMAVAVAVGGIAATDAAAAAKVHKSMHSHRWKHARLEHGLLSVKGTSGPDAIVLGLKPGNPGILEVAFGPKRFDFRRNRIRSIAVNA